MTCKGAKKYLPLLAGRELSPKKAARVQEHLQGCPACRKEAEEIAAALDAAKGLARNEALRDWTDAEWRHMLRNVTAATIEKSRRPVRLVHKPAFALVLSLLVFAAGMFLLNKKLNITSERLTPLPGQSRMTAERREGSSGQDVLSLTIVSRETGLKIVWFFNKNFEWKENEP